MNNIKLKKLFREGAVYLCFLVLITAAFLSAFTVKGELCAENISQRLIRLHVIASSDSDSDQNLKRKVRDALIIESAALFDGCENIFDAEKICRENKLLLEKAARKVVEQEGFDYTVSTKFDYELYPVRRYEEFTLPAGEYLSLRVIIGEGKGKNWWCVLYPPLCTSYASRTVSTDKKCLSEYGFSDNEIAILEDGEPDKSGKIVLKSYLFDMLFKNSRK